MWLETINTVTVKKPNQLGVGQAQSWFSPQNALSYARTPWSPTGVNPDVESTLSLLLCHSLKRVNRIRIYETLGSSNLLHRAPFIWRVMRRVRRRSERRWDERRIVAHQRPVHQVYVCCWLELLQRQVRSHSPWFSGGGGGKTKAISVRCRWWGKRENSLVMKNRWYHIVYHIEFLDPPPLKHRGSPRTINHREPFGLLTGGLDAVLKERCYWPILRV